MTSLPIRVTAHRGILSQKLQSSMAVTISAGKTVDDGAPKPVAFIMEDTTPWMMSRRASISSMP